MPRPSPTHCGLCDRPLGPINASLARLGVALCPRCYGRPCSVRTAQRNVAMRPSPGDEIGVQRRVYTFYVRSLSVWHGPEATRPEYVVKRFRASMTCTCPDYIHRGQVLAIPCKHVRLIRLLAKAAGGFPRVPLGVTLNFRLDNPEAIRQRRGRAHA